MYARLILKSIQFYLIKLDTNFNDNQAMYCMKQPHWYAPGLNCKYWNILKNTLAYFADN